MKKVDFDQYAGNYNDLLHENTKFFSEDESYFARYKVDIAKELAGGSPARILEFGCGVGRNIPFLRAAFPSAVIMGCDVSAKSIEVAEAENSGSTFWVQGEPEGDLPQFDFIFVAGVFHHVPPPERPAAAHEAASLLARDGHMVVFEHNPYNPVTRKLVSQCAYDEGVILVPPSELRGLLQGAGLAVDRHGYSLFFPPKLKFLAGVERYLSWLPLGGQYWVHATRG